MSTNRRYAIIGGGALGGFYGTRLQQHGCEVHYLLRSDAQHVREHGWRVESVDGDFDLPNVHAYAEPRDMPRCDVVCLALKTTHNHLLGDILPHVLAEDGFVLVMQNGLDIERDVAAVVGHERVVGCLCFLCSNKVGPGHIRHLDYGKVRIAEHTEDGTPGGVTERMRDLAADLERANLEVILSEDLVLARWQKLVWNVPYNGLSVVLDATTDRLMADPDGLALVTDLMGEVQRGAAACGRTIDDDFVQQMLDHTRKMKPYRTSMKIDFDEGRPMEVQTMFTRPWDKAAQHGAALPVLGALTRQLRFLDRRNLNQRIAAR